MGDIGVFWYEDGPTGGGGGMAGRREAFAVVSASFFFTIGGAGGAFGSCFEVSAEEGARGTDIRDISGGDQGCALHP